MDLARAHGSRNNISPAEIRAELEKVLASAEMVRCPQLQRFLHFVVEEELAGRGAQLKEYVLAVGVFGRPADFDPRLDSLVRVEARRLRGALERYYRAQGRSDCVVIELQKGSYLPSFRREMEADRTRNALSIETLSTPQGSTVSPVVISGTQLSAARSLIDRPAKIVLSLVVGLALVVTTVLFFRTRHVQALTERDTIVLAEFVNSTGDSIFDYALRQGLTMELEQSPFLNILSDRRTGQVLKLMGRSPTEHLSPELAREVCLRTDSKALVVGSIARLGNRYVIGLTATNCSTGDGFAHLQAEADNKEAVLGTLGRAAFNLRGKLGESLSSIHRFDAPLEDATTPSLEALQAYSLGRKTARERGSPADIPFYKRAIELDPNFAAAYVAMGVSYVNLGQPSVGSDYIRKAYELRERVSEREKYRISASYYQVVTGELEKSTETYELWKQSYPRDFAPHINLGVGYTWSGEYEKSAAESKQAMHLEPTNVLPYSNLAAAYIKLDRTTEAASVLNEALARSLTSKFVRSNLCYLAFLRNDSATVTLQLSEVKDKVGDEDPLLSQQSDTEAYFGRLRSARDFSRRAVESASRAGAQEAAAGWLVNSALREAEYGNRAAARRDALLSLHLAPGRDVTVLAALALARAGDLPQAERLLRRLQRDFPSNTVLRTYWVPTIGAAIAIGKGNSGEALELLQTVSPYELGSPPPMGLATLYPVYLRGESYLLGRQGDPAAREFQKILDHPGLVLNFPLHALAHLQLGKARVLVNDQAGARQAFQDFLVLWKDADPDVPVLRNAKMQYARMQ